MKVFRNNKLNHVQLYFKIKKRCQFQLNFSGFLLIFFFVLQYSVPILLVVLGSAATSREQLIAFLKESPPQSVKQPIAQSANADKEPPSNIKSDEDAKDKKAEILVSKIIFLLGIITILLGVINNTIRPAESYDTCSSFNNKFNKFNIDLDLEMLELGGLRGNSSVDPQEINLIICKFLIKKNNELFDLIDEYNKARSLSPRQANIKALDQNDDKKESPNPSNPSGESSDSTTDNSLAGLSNNSTKSSNGTTDKSLVDAPTIPKESSNKPRV